MILAEQRLKSYTGPIKFKIMHHEINKGLSEARNTGIKAATGDYLYFLDSDDEITLDCIGTLVKESEDYEAIIGSVALSSGEIYFKNKGHIFQGNEIKNAYFERLIHNMACNKLIRRDFLLLNNLFFEPGLIHEDYLWTFFVSMSCNKLKTIENMTYIYHIRKDSLNTNFTIKHMNHYIFGFNKIEEYLFNDLNISKEKYKYLIEQKYSFKNFAIIRFNVSFQEFKNLGFSKTIYPFFIWDFKLFCENSILKLPSYLQYKLIKIMNKYIFNHPH
jgi:glycosyltransferase involved in cell wall biosynthesis